MLNIESKKSGNNQSKGSKVLRISFKVFSLSVVTRSRRHGSHVHAGDESFVSPVLDVITHNYSFYLIYRNYPSLFDLTPM